MQTHTEKLNAENLKNMLWETLQDVKSEVMDSKTANAIAAQARGILGTVRTEIAIQHSTKALTNKIKDFTR